MSQTYEVHTYETDDIQSVAFKVNDEVIVALTTYYDAPEDNSCSRLGVASAFEDIVREIGLSVSRVEHDYGDEPD